MLEGESRAGTIGEDEARKVVEKVQRCDSFYSHNLRRGRVWEALAQNAPFRGLPVVHSGARHLGKGSLITHFLYAKEAL